MAKREAEKERVWLEKQEQNEKKEATPELYAKAEGISAGAHEEEMRRDIYTQRQVTPDLLRLRAIALEEAGEV